MSNKFVLYLDTSTEEAVLAIYADNNLLKELKWQAHRELSVTLSQKYQEILKKAKITQKDLTGIVVFVGPGSFTGLRIGISFANGMAFGLGISIYETRKKQSFDLSDSRELAMPFYGAPPKITKPKDRK